MHKLLKLLEWWILWIVKIKFRNAELWECCSLVSGPYHNHDVQLANVVEGDRLRLPIPVPIRDQAAPFLRHILWQRQGASKVKKNKNLASKFWMTFFTGPFFSHRLLDSVPELGATDAGQERVSPDLDRKKRVISRDNLLKQAEQVMQELASSRSLLEIQYENEVSSQSKCV